jgi:predicted XRE-type DNA-binding protein
MTYQNIFALFEGKVEANISNYKSSLMIAIVSAYRESGMTQAAFAELAGVSQPRMSNLMNAKLRKFSVDSLLEILVRIGYEVRPVLSLDWKDRPLTVTLVKEE